LEPDAGFSAASGLVCMVVATPRRISEDQHGLRPRSRDRLVDPQHIRALAVRGKVEKGSALAIAVLGMIGGSNIVPIWVVFAIPICFVLTIGLWVARGIAWIMKPA
jgi:hypothetical protein